MKKVASWFIGLLLLLRYRFRSTSFLSWRIPIVTVPSHFECAYELAEEHDAAAQVRRPNLVDGVDERGRAVVRVVFARRVARLQARLDHGVLQPAVNQVVLLRALQQVTLLRVRQRFPDYIYK